MGRCRVWVLPFRRDCYVTGFVEPDRVGGCRRKVQLPASHPRSAIIDSNRDTAIVADNQMCTERQCTMRGGHCRAIEPLTARGAMTTQAVAATVDARYFRSCWTKRRKNDTCREYRSKSDAAHTRFHDVPCLEVCCFDLMRLK